MTLKPASPHHAFEIEIEHNPYPKPFGTSVAVHILPRLVRLCFE